MICEFGLTLSPLAETLSESRQDNSLMWLRRALAKASRKRMKTERLHIVRQVLSGESGLKCP